MADKVQFELVSPERLLASQAVDMVTAPGSEGEFGVLPNHAPFIATLRPGVIKVHEGGQIVDRIFVAGGVVEVTKERCTVLAEQATPVAEIDRAAAEKDVADLNEDLQDATVSQERRAVAARLAVAKAKAQAAA